MPFVRFREKAQLTVPAQVVRDLKLRVGDMVDVEGRGKKLVLSRQDVVDRAILAGRADYDAVRVTGPFSTVAEGFAPVRPARRRSLRARK